VKPCFLALLLGALGCWPSRAKELPDAYFHLLNAGLAQVEQRLSAEPTAHLHRLEARQAWRHFPSAILVAAVLYTRKNPANPRFADGKALATALAVGDLLAREQERGQFMTRLDYHRDTYMWLEAYRLLQGELGEQRRAIWREDLLEILTPLPTSPARDQFKK